MGFWLGSKTRSLPGGPLPLTLRCQAAICVPGEIPLLLPQPLTFTKGAIELRHLPIEADCGEEDRANFIFFSFVCSANQDQFYYILFIRGNHLGLHYNKHIGVFPLLQPLLAVLLRIISQPDRSTTCQQTCSVCVLYTHPALN